MSGRAIVLLSDGTGNSAAKISKTNVWRIFQAIDLEAGDQFAFYDDGVGSGGNKFLKGLGGAFGFGLARNVRQLYEDLCRHYRSGDDRIILFGFSRGAFTVRMLSGLIAHCGIIDRDAGKTVDVWRWRKLRREPVPVSTDEGMKAAIRIAYRAVRKRNDKAPVSRIFRWIRDRFFVETPKTEKFRMAYSVSPRPRIAFLGVFDTVSAYGLPIDEMTIAIHKWILPLRFPDMILSNKVEHAVQALALDEARQTFHPMLWTERTFDPDGGEGDPDPRPHQAWFAGVHSDIGGGYSNERLSLVPAVWMLEEAQDRTGLRLRAAAFGDLKARASAFGELHDSRGGLAAFYRYKPRILAELGDEDLDGNRRKEVIVDRFKIHHSVFDRIRESGADYAPIGIPEDYDVVREAESEDGKTVRDVVSAGQAGYETDAERARRADIQRGIEDTVFLRKVAYYLMTGVGLALVVIPLLWLSDPAVIPDRLGSSLAVLFAGVLGFVPLPGADRIGQFWVHHSTAFIGLVAVFALAFAVSRRLAGTIQSKAQAAWRHVAGGTLSDQSPRRQWIERWRAHTQGFHRVWTKRAFPVVLIVAIFFLPPATALWRWFLFTPFGGDSVCTFVHAKATADNFQEISNKDKTANKCDAEADSPNKSAGDERIDRCIKTDRPQKHAITFDTVEPCVATWVEMKKGRDYKISVAVDAAWKDGGLEADPTGISWFEIPWSKRPAMTIAVLSRRYWSEKWFALMGSIGRGRENAFRIHAKRVDVDPASPDDAGFTYTFRAWRTGRLYLFVNDAINPFAGERFCRAKEDFDPERPWHCYYANNSGTASITIEETRER